MSEKQPTSKRVTIKDIASVVGVSPSTVSLVLSEAPRAEALAPETRARVRQTARKLGYRPNYLARSLRGKRTYSLGVVVPEFSEGYTAGLMSGVEGEVVRGGYTYLMASHGSRPSRLESSIRLLEDRGVEGLIVIGAELRKPSLLPTVIISGRNRIDGATNVVLDHRIAAEKALQHLVDLGHRRIAVLRGYPGNVDAADRWRAISETAERLELEIPPKAAPQLRSPSYGEAFDPEGGYREGFEYGANLLETGIPFTALFSFNDISAIGAVRAFLDAGRRVPEDISVIGFDDLGSTPFLNPRLTTIRQPLRRMGETAVKLLIEHLDTDQDRLDQVVTIEPELIVRDSTAAPVQP